MADVRFLVEVDATGAVKSVKNFDGALDDLKKKSGETETAHKSLWKQVALGQFAYDAARKAGRLFVDFMQDSVKAAIEAEDSENNLRSALESTGRTVAPLAEHFIKYSQELQRNTVYGDEAIQGAQALLLQLTTLDKDGIDKATKGAIGMASVFKTDLQSAATLVAKAMAGNTSALSRYGIILDDSLSKEAKQAQLLEKLSVFYGRAEAETDTFGGSLKQLGNNWGDMQEVVGGAITKSESFKGAIKGLNEWVVKLTSSDDFKLWLNTVIDGLVAAGKAVGWFVKGIKDVSTALAGGNKANREYEESQVKLNAALDRAALAGHDYRKRMDDIREAAKTAAPAINEVGNATRIDGEASKKAAEEKKKFSDAVQEIINRGTPLTTALIKIKKEQELLNKAFKAGIIDEKALAKGTANLGDELARLVSPVASADNALLKIAMDAKTKVIPGFQATAVEAAKAAAVVKKSWAEAAKDWVNKNQEALNQVLGATRGIVGQIDAIQQQSTNNRMIALDNEYQKRLETIKNSLMSETEKNAAITALDAEYEMKRRQLQKQAAEKAKATAIANAIINVIEGVTKALGSMPPPWNFILAAITAAAGAIQIAKIRATPIPLAAGAIFQRPVFSPGGDYQAGEAGPEAVIPLRELPRIMRELGGARVGGGDNRPVVNEFHIYIDGREMKAFVTKTVRESGALGYLGTFGKAVS